MGIPNSKTKLNVIKKQTQTNPPQKNQQNLQKNQKFSEAKIAESPKDQNNPKENKTLVNESNEMVKYEKIQFSPKSDSEDDSGYDSPGSSNGLSFETEVNDEWNQIFKVGEKELKFINKIVNEINKARLSPLYYSKKIKQYQSNIKIDKKENKKYILSKNRKLFLPSNEDGFENCINYLTDLEEKMDRKGKYLERLIFKEELKIPFPVNDLDKAMDPDYFSRCYSVLQEKFKGTYEMVNMLYYKATKDPEASTILQIVDQNSKGRIRRVLLGEKVRYIGVNYGVLSEGVYVVYLILAK